MDPNITTAPVFPGDDADGVAVVGARTEAVRHAVSATGPFSGELRISLSPQVWQGAVLEPAQNQALGLASQVLVKAKPGARFTSAE